MTPRERVLTSIAHKEPDRVPVDLGSTPSSGISAIAYGRLKKRLGIHSGHTLVYDVVQQVAQPEDALLDRFGVDVLDVGRAFNTEESDWYDVLLPDGSPARYPVWFRPQAREDGCWDVVLPDGTRIATMPVGSTFFDQTCFPYVDGYPADYSGLAKAMGKVQWGALALSPWDNASRDGFWQTLRDRALALRQSSDRALIMGCGCNLFEWGTFLRRLDNFLADLVTAPAEVERLLDALLEQHLATLEKVCAAVGDIVDIIRFGDDLGMETGPLMSPATYRSLFKPRHAMLCDYVKKHSRARPFLHSCGSIYRLLPDLIEAGYDIVNPVQTSCREMEPERLKRDFGADLTFWGGGCDTRTVLNRATPQEVKDHVRRRLDVFAPGGGFVFSAIHNILPDVAPGNIIAMFEALGECSR